MSEYANPTNANVWLDGDAFRGAPGIKPPADFFAKTIENMLAYGGVEAGFNITTEQSVTKKKVFNYRQSAYKVTRDPLDEGVTFRAVDDNEATRLTRAMGGKVTIVDGRYRLEKGDGEEFSFLLRLDDGEDDMAIWCPRATLSSAPTRAAIDGQTIDGWEFALTFLEKPIEILPGKPTSEEIAAAHS